MRAENTTPSAKIFDSVILSLCEASDVARSMDMLKLSSSLGHEPSVDVKCSLLNMLAATENFEAAKELFAKRSWTLESALLERVVNQELRSGNIALAAKRFHQLFLQAGNRPRSRLAHQMLHALVVSEANVGLDIGLNTSENEKLSAAQLFDMILTNGADLALREDMTTDSRHSFSQNSYTPDVYRQDKETIQAVRIDTLPQRKLKKLKKTICEFGTSLLLNYAGENFSSTSLHHAINFTASHLNSWAQDNSIFDKIVVYLCSEAPENEFRSIAGEILGLNLKLNSFTYGKILNRLNHIGAFDAVCLLYRNLNGKTNFSRMAINAILVAHVNLGEIDKALTILLDLRTEDHVDVKSYVIVLSALMKKNRHTDALSLVQEMMDAGIQPNLMILTFVAEIFTELDAVDRALAACNAIMSHHDASKSPREFRKRALRIFAKIVSTRATCDEVLAIFDTLCEKYGRLIKADAVNTVLATGGKVLSFADLQRVFLWMKQKGIQPDVYTFSSLLNPVVEKFNKEGISFILSEMDNAGVVPNDVILCQLLGFFVKSSDADGMLKVWKYALSHGLSWNPPMGLLGPMLSYIPLEEAQAIFQHLRTNGYPFDKRFLSRASHLLSRELGPKDPRAKIKKKLKGLQCWNSEKGDGAC
ncbi:hypothetical protein HDU97_006319 [Phlyctochytrium planicorne]|nr:hypothetical protein HDU97_006319 [Phlyctochytrium planicorne]